VPEPPLLAASAPVFTVGGRQEGDLSRDCLRLEVEEGADGLRTLVLHLVASAAREPSSGDVVEHLDGRTLGFGTEVQVALGPREAATTVFTGRVSALEVHFDEGDVPHVTVRAEDALMHLRGTRRSRTYRQVSDADVARRIAGEHGLSADAAAGGPTYDVVQQVNETDLGFLRARAALVGAEVWVTDGTLHFADRGRRAGAELRLVCGADLVQVHLAADLARQRSGVRVSGFDAGAGERIDVESPASAVLAEVSGGRTGPQVLEEAFSRRPEQRVRLVPLSREHASSWARAENLRRARGFVTARGATAGSPDLAVGSRLHLSRVGQPFDGGGYYVTAVRHTYDLAHGFRTCFEAERATVGGGS
jgi:uncharacterized protein